MTQQEHDDAMKKLRDEFATFFNALEIKTTCAWNAPDIEAIRGVAWKAFTHGKIPKVDRD